MLRNKLMGAAGGSPTDPSFNNVSLLLHGDGTNGAQNNTFLDSSSNNFTITRYGNTTQGTFSPFPLNGAAYDPAVNGGSGYFDGSGDYLSVPYNAALRATGDFTLEAWINPTALVAAAYSNAIYDMDSYWRLNFSLLIDGTTKYPVFLLSSDNSNYDVFLTGTTVVQLNTWQHIAICRSGSAITMYLNGYNIGTASSSASPYVDGVTEINIGAIANGGSASDRFFNGYISNLRVVNGTAVYTSNFTPPTAPLTAISGTSLLCNFTNAGIYDNAAKNDLETVGNAQVSTSVKKYGTGSMYFDGTGDYLTSPASPQYAFGTGDFTVEAWVYALSGISEERGFVQTSSTAGGLMPSYADGISISFRNVGSSFYWNIAGTTLIGGTAVLNAWLHLALTRQSGTTKAFVNGVQVASGTAAGTCSGTYLAVGGYYSASYLWNGYIDDLRITKGVARYTANFTPPTQAFPNQ